MSTTDLGLEIAHQIVARARRFGWRAGTPLVERTLAADLGVSRSPVRDALHLLVERGIVARTEASRALVLSKDAESLSADELDAALPSSEVETIYITLVRDRFTRELPEHINETELLRRYDVGRPLLRKALLRLAQEGLAQRSRGHGWEFLSMIDSSEADRESYEFRLAIEPAGIRSANFKADPGWLEKIRGRHQAMLAGDISETSRAEFFQLNVEFHERLAEFSGNRYFLQAVQQQNRLRRAVEYESFDFSERMSESCREHIAVLNALIAGDRELAASLLLHHLTMSRQLPLPFASNEPAATPKPKVGLERPSKPARKRGRA